MSEVYNPETQAYERLEALEVEARELRRQRAAAGSDEARQVLDQQAREIEERIGALKKKLRR